VDPVPKQNKRNTQNKQPNQRKQSKLTKTKQMITNKSKLSNDPDQSVVESYWASMDATSAA